MNEMSLSRLYRRLISERAQPAVNVDDLVEVVASSADAGAVDEARRERIAADLAQSPPHADLARMLHALQPVSESLARDVRDSRQPALHPARVREQRIAAGARRGHRVHRLRWASGIAACLSVALGLWSWHHVETARHAEIAMHGASASVSDRIFVSNDVIFASSDNTHRRKQNSGASGDELFSSHFSG